MKKTALLLLIVLLPLSFNNAAEQVWKEVSTGIDATFEDIYFPSPETGYAVGSTIMTDILMKTTDAGESWKRIKLPNEMSTPRKVYFTDNNTGYIAGAYGLFKTTDGGETWRETFDPSGYLSTLCFSTAKIGFAGGGGYADSPVICKSVDAGESWKECSLTLLVQGDSPYIYDICFTDSRTGFAVGHAEEDRPVYLTTTDGGETWSERDLGIARAYLRRVLFTDKKTGFILGNYYNSDDLLIPTRTAVVLKTTDGGKTWKPQQTFENIFFYDMHFPDAKTGYIVGSYNIYKTTDGGETWSAESVNYPYLWAGKCVFFTDTKTGYVGSSRGSIYKSTPDYSGIGDTESTDGAFAPYPNPAETSVTIPCPAEGGRLKVFNTLGVTQYEVTIESGADRITLPVAGWPKGHYFFECNGTKGRFVVK